MGISIDKFVSLCLEQLGERYVFGAEVALDADLHGPEVWDCSELVQVCSHQAGVNVPDGSQNQRAFCRNADLMIPISKAKTTRGALLFNSHHVAVSLGDGTTIEARGHAYGVGSWNIGDRFVDAGLIPGYDYGSTERDWFDMASKADLTAVLKVELDRRDKALNKRLDKIEKALYKEVQGYPEPLEHLDIIEADTKLIRSKLGAG